MHQNQPGLYTTNSLSSHASLLLSASPTIITSPLQNNTNNNPQNAPIPPPIALARRQPSTPLLVASNLDNDSQQINDSSIINSSNEGYINFKKPQNEIFKKLDGKIQKIVAAHSNLNKLYALNDFTSLGVGPKRPFELPPQLPPPPPWIPKVSGELSSQWDDEPVSPISVRNPIPKVEIYRVKPASSSLLDTKSRMIAPVKQNPIGSGSLLRTAKAPSLTLDSAISKLHQRRQQQQQQQQQQHKQQQQRTQQQPSQLQMHRQAQLNPKTNLNIGKLPHGPIPSSSSSTGNNQSTPTITPAQFSLLAQKIKETLETECANNTQRGSLSEQDKKKFQQDLIALLKREIYDVTKSSSIKFKPTVPNLDPKPKVNEQRSLLLKSSPQTLFNTIRRETSILLNKRQQQAGRSSLSLLSDQQTFNRQDAHNVNTSLFSSRPQPITRQHTIKVIVPPIESHDGLKFTNYLEKEAPEPNTDMITVEQFAKCLNLVRSNDASLQRHQEHLLQSETKWKSHVSTRPLRLRRIRGERIHMPASASYKATRKVGLQ